jgi:carboxymethylenebutenolidase
MRLRCTGLSIVIIGSLATPARAALAPGHAQHRPDADATASDHVAHDTSRGLPAGAAEAQARLDASPRHGEWVMIATGPSDSVRAWVVYPERKTKAPVVVVIHEIFGLSPWVRAVADQFAADGFIAIAPDLLTSKNIPGSPLTPNPDSARVAIRTLDRDVIHRQLTAVGGYGTSLPAATGKYGIVGFCWGGARSFHHAAHAPSLGASVVYYGSPPTAEEMAAIKAPVLGLYGGSDARINATIPATDSTMKRLGKSYEYHIFDGAGHGFLRGQDGNEPNTAASKQAWPRTVAFLKSKLGG